MAVNLPTLLYSPMPSPRWTQSQPPATPSANRPPRPEEKGQNTRQKSTIRLVLEPLSIPGAALASVIQSYPLLNNGRQVTGVGVDVDVGGGADHRDSPTVGIDINPLDPKKNTTNRKPPSPPRRKFSYDSTSSTENYLLAEVPSPSPIAVLKKLPPPQHILSQSREYHQQASKSRKNSPIRASPSPPSPLILQKLQRPTGTHLVLYDPFQPHPDYPHMSPYMDDDDEELDDEYEDVMVDDDDGDDDGDGDDIYTTEDVEVDDYYCFDGEEDIIAPRKSPGGGHHHEKEATKDWEDTLMNDNDSGFADYVPPPPQPKSPPPPPPLQSLPTVLGLRAMEENQKVGATLSGPFVAAFDGFDICLP